MVRTTQRVFSVLLIKRFFAAHPPPFFLTIVYTSACTSIKTFKSLDDSLEYLSSAAVLKFLSYVFPRSRRSKIRRLVQSLNTICPIDTFVNTLLYKRSLYRNYFSNLFLYRFHTILHTVLFTVL